MVSRVIRVLALTDTGTSSWWHGWSLLFKHTPAHTVPNLGPYLL